MTKRRNKKSRYTARHLRQKDNLLYENLQYIGDSDTPTDFELIVFDSESITKADYSKPAELCRNLDREKNNYITVNGLQDVNEIRLLCENINIPRLWMQDILNSNHIAKIEEATQGILLIVDYYTLKDELLDTQKFSFFLAKNLIVSFQESTEGVFDEIKTALDNHGGHVRDKSVDYLLNLLISNIINNNLMVLDKIIEQMIDIEDLLMQFSDNVINTEIQIQNVRKNLLKVRRGIFPLRDNFNVLLNSAFIEHANHIYYKDTNDHLLQAVQMITGAQETISSLVDLYLANNDLKMNRTMSRLTVVSTIFIPLTFLVGVWGMNFTNMPELTWKYGYLFAWSIMALSVVIVIYWLKKQRMF
ncbi:MAG: magnesium and cobalt transport protein CorA [Tannerella sp.]|jgi:magnesium transporter|nr:magnesium and cobalt transport protein CorA [Tannerella sp.]